MVAKRAGWILVLVLTLTIAANAGTIVVTGSGVWADYSATTTYSAPGASWAFSFMIPDTIDVVAGLGGGFLTTQATAFSYTLDGSPVATALGGVEFYPTSMAGLFDLRFTDSTVGLFGNQAYSGTSSPLTLLPGVYVATSGTGAADGSGSVTLAAAPEPATWLLFAPALGLLALRRRR